MRPRLNTDIYKLLKYLLDIFQQRLKSINMLNDHRCLLYIQLSIVNKQRELSLQYTVIIDATHTQLQQMFIVRMVLN